MMTDACVFPCGRLILLRNSLPTSNGVELGLLCGCTSSKDIPTALGLVLNGFDLLSCFLVTCTAPPVAVADRYVLNPTGATTVQTSILANDIVPCGTAATITVVKSPAHGVLSSLAVPGALGIFTYTPNDLNLPVDDSFDYKVTCDGLEVRHLPACVLVWFPDRKFGPAFPTHKYAAVNAHQSMGLVCVPAKACAMP